MMDVTEIPLAVSRAEFLMRNGMHFVRVEDLFFIAEAEIVAERNGLQYEACYFHHVGMKLKCSTL